MGNSEVIPATCEQIDEFFKQECFTVSENWDVDKLQGLISDLKLYVGHQLELQKSWDPNKIKVKDALNKKGLSRKGVPDIIRRKVFLHEFELEPMKWKVSFKAVYGHTNLEEIEIAKEDAPSLPFLHTHCLNKTGLDNLEVVVHLLYKEKFIEYSPILINTIAILLIYLPVEEAYCVVQKMMEKSATLLGDPKTKKLMRWYFTFTKMDYCQTLGTFIQSYIDTTRLKKRSILIHLQSIGFDINELLDEFIKYFFTSFLSFDYVVDIFTFYYLEGAKVIFRFVYAILKVHKKNIKSLKDPQTVRDMLAKMSNKETDWSYLHQRAFKYNLQRNNYNINKVDKVELNDEREEYKVVSDFLPNINDCPSNILSLKQFYRLWMMLPEYCQIRVPKILYWSTEDGYSLSTMYMKCNKYHEKMSVKFCFLIIRTLDNDIFGAFIDSIINKSITKFFGSSESFIFGFYEDKRITHYSENINQNYWVGGEEYLQIGSGGDGPAIYLKDSLQEGQTNACETFGNDVLTSDKKHHFKVQSIELIMI